MINNSRKSVFNDNTNKVNIFEDCIEYFEKEITKQKDINIAKTLITKLIFKYWSDDESELFGAASYLQKYLNNNYLNHENNNVKISVLIYWIKEFKKQAKKNLQNKLPQLRAEINKYCRYLETYEPKSRARSMLRQAEFNIDEMDRYIEGYWSGSWTYSDGTPIWKFDRLLKEEFAIEKN